MSAAEQEQYGIKIIALGMCGLVFGDLAVLQPVLTILTIIVAGILYAVFLQTPSDEEILSDKPSINFRD